MSKPLLGFILGALLGLIDGLGAYFTPAVRSMYLGIVLASTFKGLLTGLLTGMLAQRTQRLALSVGAGALIGLVLSFAAAAATPDPEGQYYYFQIMAPGGVLGAIVGFSTHRFGVSRARTSRATKA